MKLSIATVQRLYGPKLYILQESVTDENSIMEISNPQLFLIGQSVDWKMKPNTQMVLILKEEEFSQKPLIDLLKSMVLKAQIPTDLIGFGIMPKDAEEISLEDIPTPVGVLYGPPGTHIPDSMRLRNCDIFISPSLQHIADHPNEMDQMAQTLQRAKFILNI